MEAECEVLNYTLNEAEALAQLPSKFDEIAILGLMPTILCLGTVANLAFLAMLLRVPKMRSFTNFYLANLAAADAVFLLFAISSKIYQYRASGVNFSVVYGGAFGCLLKYFVVDSAYFASLFMVTMVSLDKFRAICRPVRHRLANSWRRTVTLSVGSWAASLLFAAAIVPSYSHVGVICTIWPPGDRFRHLSLQFGYCGPEFPWAGSFSNIFQTVPFFTTLALNTTLYALIVRRLSQRVEQPLGRPNNQFPQRALRTRNQAAKMLVINGIVFFLLLAPFEVVSVLLMTDLLAPWSKRQLALQICRLLAYLNSAVNPFIYGAVNPKYRQAYGVAFFPGHQNRVNVRRQDNLQEEIPPRNHGPI